jgi:hypothetical protein
MPEESAVEGLIDRFLAHHALFFPVDATFMGLGGANHRLPPAHREARDAERDALADLSRELRTVGEGRTLGERLDIRLLGAAVTHARMATDLRPRYEQPTWYTGEVAFGLISLLLPSAPSDAIDALPERLGAIPRFLDEGATALADRPVPPDWVIRASRECDALRRLLSTAIRLHPFWCGDLEDACNVATAAVMRFRSAITGLAPAGVACGRDFLAVLMRDVHGLPWSPEEAVELAGETFTRLGSEIADQKRHLDGQVTPGQGLVNPCDLPDVYRAWHEQTMAVATDLVSPANDYTLSFAPLPEWARAIAGDLYFLSYRSPPGLAAGRGSTYWTAPLAQPHVAIKQTHAVHHGSIGHHTQNARARHAASRLARLGGTDCASGIAFLSSGTMVEGWSSYTTDLMREIDGFYSPMEIIAQLEAERRNAASVIADIKLHTGEWTLKRMRAFYMNEAGFPAQRVWGETTRNSILPATRLMYFLGTQQIKDLRRAQGGSTSAFHDGLLSYGHVPLAWAADELRRSRQVQTTGCPSPPATCIA